MSGSHSPRFLVPAAALAFLLGLVGCGEDSETCPTCPDTGFRTFVIRPDGNGDRPTIQDAINDALRGDVILLEDGVYRGPGNRDLTVDEKGLVILSRSGNPAACYIDCGDAGEEGIGVLRMAGNREGLRMDGIGFHNARFAVGGAIYSRGSTLHLINCVFLGNQAESGGGLASIDSDVLLEDCIFESNSADLGGGMWADGGDVRLYGCSFRNNHAGDAGGGVGARGTGLEIRDCIFNGNRSFGSGGGIHTSRGSLTVFGTKCFYNVSEQSGGALYVEEARSAVIVDSDIAANEARSGSAVYSECSLMIRGCTVTGNLAGDQGALRHAAGVLLVESCTIAGNTGPSPGAAVVLSGESQAILERCILAYNHDGLAVRCYGDARVLLNCCDVYGHSQGDYEECLAGQEGQRGNISQDPLFCGDPDYRLAEDSPCATAPCGLIGSGDVGCRQAIALPHTNAQLLLPAKGPDLPALLRPCSTKPGRKAGP